MGASAAATVESPKDTTEAWNDKDQRITVTEGNGFLYRIQLQQKVGASPDEVYDILTDPYTVSIFRSIKECTYRNILEDDGKGRRKLEVGHRAVARFLFLSVSFDTHLHVWEDRNARSIHFVSAREGVMKRFEGTWHIQPFNQASLDSWFHPERQPQHRNPFEALPFFHHQPKPARDSLVTLEQCILPRGPSPPGIKGLVRSLCAYQVKNMMEDLHAELDRRANGTSSVLKEREERLQRERQERMHAGKAAKAASISLAATSLWYAAAPINIVIKL